MTNLAGEANTWYVFGDSIAKGIIFNEELEKYNIAEQNFVHVISETYHVTIKNFSIFGATVNKGIKMFLRSEKKLKADSIALLEFGGNDSDFTWSEVAQDPKKEHLCHTPHTEFQNKYEELIHLLQAKNIRPIILNLPPLDENRYFNIFSKDLNKENLLEFLGGSTGRIYQWHESYNSMLYQIAQNTNTEIIDIRAAFLTELNPERFICLDGIHPNEKGQILIANQILEYISSSDLLPAAT